LFLASSGGYDPVISHYSQLSLQTTEINHFIHVQAAVNQSAWADMGIQSSRDYLCHLFDVNEIINAEEPDFEDSMAGFMDQSSAYAQSTNIVDFDHVKIDDFAIPEIGRYKCLYSGCVASPFPTQHLNTYTNEHTARRLHYCPAKGCPRSAGRKGFKRRNEMTRHRITHKLPEYICPFCLDREHKYPRPENLCG
jgi:hypothetical protein